MFLLTFRDGSGYRNGWNFGKTLNGLFQNIMPYKALYEGPKSATICNLLWKFSENSSLLVACPVPQFFLKCEQLKFWLLNMYLISTQYLVPEELLPSDAYQVCSTCTSQRQSQASETGRRWHFHLFFIYSFIYFETHRRWDFHKRKNHESNRVQADCHHLLLFFPLLGCWRDLPIQKTDEDKTADHLKQKDGFTPIK